MSIETAESTGSRDRADSNRRSASLNLPRKANSKPYCISAAGFGSLARGQLQFTLRGRPIPIVGQRNESEVRAGLGQSRVNAKRFVIKLLGLGNFRLRVVPAIRGRQVVFRRSQAVPSHGVFGVDLHSSAEILLGPGNRFGSRVVDLEGPTFIEIVRLQVWNMPGGDRVARACLQASRDGRRELGLNGQQILRRTIVGLRPDMRSVRRTLEMRADPDLVSGTLRASFEYIGYVELTSHFANIGVRALEDPRRSTGNHSERIEMDQFLGDLVRETVREILVRRIGT